MSLYAIETIISAFFEIPVGIISDRIGRKKIMMIGAFFRFSSFVLFSLAHNYTLLLIGVCCAGFSSALASGNNDALLYDTLSTINQKEKYHQIYAKIVSCLQSGLFLGSIIGCVFAFYSLRLCLICSIISVFFAFILTYFITEPPQSCNQNSFLKQFLTALHEIWKRRRLKYITLADCLHYGFNEASYSFNSVFIKQFVPIWSLGLLKAVGHLFNAIGATLSNKVAKKFTIDKTAVLGLILDDLTNLISVLCNNFLTPFIRLFSPFVEGIHTPAVNTIIQNEIENDIRATTLSIISIISSVCYTLAALFIGVLADCFSPYLALLIAYVCGILCDCFGFKILKIAFFYLQTQKKNSKSSI